MLFYKPGDEECKKLKDEYRALAEKMYGIVKVGAIDCSEDEELCEEFAQYSVPTMIIYQENYNDEGEKYTGKMDWKSIANFATKKMQSFVSLITSETYEQFVSTQPTKYHVLLFTERKSTPPIYKALSKQYKDKLLFGEVRKSDTEMLKRFGITEFPKIVVITDPYSFENEVYTGEIKYDRITKFLNTYSYKQAAYKKAADIVELTEQKYKSGVCKKTSSNICVILFTDASRSLVEQVRPLLSSYENDPVTFVFVDKEKEKEIHDLFGESSNSVVAYKPKRGRYAAYRDQDLSTAGVKNFVDSILGGGG